MSEANHLELSPNSSFFDNKLKEYPLNTPSPYKGNAETYHPQVSDFSINELTKTVKREIKKEISNKNELIDEMPEEDRKKLFKQSLESMKSMIESNKQKRFIDHPPHSIISPAHVDRDGITVGNTSKHLCRKGRKYIPFNSTACSIKTLVKKSATIQKPKDLHLITRQRKTINPSKTTKNGYVPQESIDKELYKYLDEHRENPFNPLKLNKYNNNYDKHSIFKIDKDPNFRGINSIEQEFQNKAHLRSPKKYSLTHRMSKVSYNSINPEYTKKVPVNFDCLVKEKFNMDEIEKEKQINRDLLKIGNGCLDVC